MDCIILEGLSLYLALFLMVLLLVIALISLVCTVLSDKRIVTLETLLYRENEKVKYLTRKNFALQLRNGEIDINEK